MLTRFYIVCLCFFLAAPAAHSQVIIFEESFDGSTGPVGWTLDDGWSLSTMTPSTGSGVNGLQHRGNAASIAAMPAVDLSGATSATLTYLARRTASYATDNLSITASGDGGLTFPVTLIAAGSAVPATDSDWEIISAPLPGELLGLKDVVIRFEGHGFYSSVATARLDDVTLTASVPLELVPYTLSFVGSVGEPVEDRFAVTNRTSAALTLQAPVVTGAEFSIAPTAVVILDPGATQEYVVAFTAPAQSTFTGSVQLDYGSGTAEVELTGSGSGGMLDFLDASSATLGESAGVGVPLSLAFNATTGLQGLQFRVSWTGDAISLADVSRGAPIADADEWVLSYELGEGFADVLLLATGSASLAGEKHEGLITLLFDVGPVTASTTAEITIASVIGALADPQGTDADLTGSTAPHVMAIQPREVFFSASAVAMDLGDVDAGETATAALTVSNPGANADLIIEEVTLSSSLYSISPSTAVVAPEASEEFTITFRPTHTAFGRQDAEITFVHNGQTKTDLISLTGRGRGGRGDAEGDGMVDALDIVHAIDFVLSRLTPGAGQKAAVDLFPFPDGDGNLDVRDLTVLVQAIVRGSWPDGIDLPLEEATGGEETASGIRIAVDQHTIEMVHDVPIRAFQVVVPANEDARVDVGASLVELSAAGENDQAGGDGTSVVYGVRAAAGAGPGAFEGAPSVSDGLHELRVVVFREDGELILPGSIRLAAQGLTGRPHYVTAIGADRNRLRIDTNVWTGVHDTSPSDVLLDRPYPNPFRAGSERLRIPAASDIDNVYVFDLLGRVVTRLEAADKVVEWDGSDAAGRIVGSGVYLVRIESGRESQTHAIQIIR